MHTVPMRNIGRELRNSHPYILGAPLSDPHMLFLQAEKVVQLVLSTVLKAYKVMHRWRTAAGPPDLHSSGAALVHGTLASKKSCMGGVPQPVRAGAPDLHSNGTALMHDFICILISFQNGAQNELHHFLCL